MVIIIFTKTQDEFLWTVHSCHMGRMVSTCLTLCFLPTCFYPVLPSLLYCASLPLYPVQRKLPFALPCPAQFYTRQFCSRGGFLRIYSWWHRAGAVVAHYCPLNCIALQSNIYVTSSCSPFGPLDFVFCPLQALKPCDWRRRMQKDNDDDWSLSSGTSVEDDYANYSLLCTNWHKLW